MTERLIYLAQMVLCVLAISACVSQTDGISSVPEIDYHLVEQELQARLLPVTSVKPTTDRGIAVEITNNPELGLPIETTHHDDIENIVDVLCGHPFGYSLQLEYSNGWSMTLDWQSIRAHCKGNLSKDQMLSEVRIQSPHQSYP